MISYIFKESKIVNNWIVLLLLFFGSMNHTYSKHIIGGEMYYKCMGTSSGGSVINYEITLIVYRDGFDPTAATFDNPAFIGIYRGSGNQYSLIGTDQDLRVSLTEETAVTISSGIECLAPPNDIKVFKGVYRFNISLPKLTNENYLIAYQRCCRDNQIFNIISAERTGAAYFVEITPEAQNTCYNSAVFKDQPPIVICLDEDVRFDHSVIDMEADSIEYGFFNPFTAGGRAMGDPDRFSCVGVTPRPSLCPPPYRKVNFNQPTFTFQQPIQGDPPLTIDSKTGELFVHPTLTGRYVVGVYADSYKNNVFLGRIYRDFQFYVAVCDPTVKVSIQSDSISPDGAYVFKRCMDQSIDLICNSDPTYIVSYDWEINTSTGDNINAKGQTVNLELPYGEHSGKLYLNNDFASKKCRDTADVKVLVYPGGVADFDIDYSECEKGISIKNNSDFVDPIDQYVWRFNDKVISNKMNVTNFQPETPGKISITLNVKDINGCKAGKMDTLPYFPAPPIIVVKPDRFKGCTPALIKFNNLSAPIDSTYKVSWRFNDLSVEGLHPVVTLEEPGLYDVSITIESPLGCTVSRDFDDYVNVFPGPTAKFDYVPQEPTLTKNNIKMLDRSEDAVRRQWFVNDVSLGQESSASYMIPDTGQYEIKLVAFRDNGCTDTSAVRFTVYGGAQFSFPNAFTPNDDDLNDIFRPIGSTLGIKDYKMVVFNRWGDQVFESEDVKVGWNGHINNTGSMCEPEVYVYRVVYANTQGKKFEYKGNVLLLE